MGLWPFGVPAARPTSFGGPGAVPEVATEISGAPSTECTILGVHAINNSSADRTVTVTDTAGNLIYKATLPPGGSPPNPYSPTFEPVDGIKWSADGPNVFGHVWGY